MKNAKSCSYEVKSGIERIWNTMMKRKSHGEAVFFTFVSGKIISPNISCYVFKHQKHEYIIHHCFHGLSFKMKRRKKLGEICPTCKNTNGFLNMNTLEKGKEGYGVNVRVTINHKMHGKK